MLRPDFSINVSALFSHLWNKNLFPPFLNVVNGTSAISSNPEELCKEWNGSMNCFLSCPIYPDVDRECQNSSR